jgi:hypothetical protein
MQRQNRGTIPATGFAIEDFQPLHVKRAIENVHVLLDGDLSDHSAGTRIGASLLFTKNTRNFAGLLSLAFRLTR